MILLSLENKSVLKVAQLALNRVAIVRIIFLLTKSSIRSDILLNVSFKNSNVIAELLPVTTNSLNDFLLLFTLLAFLFGYFDLFNTS